jgi:anti-sigma B factor antagonist
MRIRGRRDRGAAPLDPSKEQDMAFAITSDGHGFILQGDLDIANEREFAAAFGEALGSGGPVSVDMRQLRFMDSSGIKVMVEAAKAAPDDCIILHGVNDSVQKVVEITGVEQLPNIHVVPCTFGVPA